MVRSHRIAFKELSNYILKKKIITKNAFKEIKLKKQKQQLAFLPVLGSFKGFLNILLSLKRSKNNTELLSSILKLKLTKIALSNVFRFNAKSVNIGNIALYQTLHDYFFLNNTVTKINRNTKWYSMEEIINHFLFYAEGPRLPSGFSTGNVEAPKGHLGVSIVSNGSQNCVRSRIRSSIQVMAGQLNSIVQGTSLGDFVVIVSGSNIVVGEIDR